MILFKGLVNTIYLSLPFRLGDFIALSLELNICLLDHLSQSSLSQTCKSSAPNYFDGVNSVTAKENAAYMFTVSFSYMSGAEKLLKQIASHPHGGYSFNVTVEVIDRATQRDSFQRVSKIRVSKAFRNTHPTFLKHSQEKHIQPFYN